jgi:methionyl-tRNA formyltransferase
VAPRLRTVFFGSSAFAVPSLAALTRAHDVIAVFTQADRPAGRGMKLRPTPIRSAAAAAGLPVFTPERLDAAFVAGVAALRPQALATVSYGKILPASLLATPSLGALNVHPSLLPAYRGAAPIQAALRDGCTRTGVTVIWMSERMDAGDIALVREVDIAPTDDFGSLHDRLADVGAEALARALARLAAGTLTRAPQDEARATFTKPIAKDDQRLRLDDARHAVNVVRSLSPKPGAWLELGGKRVKILEARAEEIAPVAAGTIVAADDERDGPLIACVSGGLRLMRVVPEGKPPMSGADFARSLR